MRNKIHALLIISVLAIPVQTEAANKSIVESTISTIIAGDLVKSNEGNTSPLKCNTGLTYIPLPAFTVPNYTSTSIGADGKLKTETVQWPNDTAQVNKLLPNIATEVSVSDLEGSASVGGIFSGSAHRKKITIDFMKYRSEPIMNEDGKTILYSRVGAGMRLVIDVNTSDASLGGNLLAIAASAKAGKTAGNISTDIIGIDAPDVTLSMPFTTDLSDGSIQKIIEALAIVKSKLNDTKTTLTPQFIARMQCNQVAPPINNNKNSNAGEGFHF